MLQIVFTKIINMSDKELQDQTKYEKIDRYLIC